MEEESSRGPSAMTESVWKQREVEADVFRIYDTFNRSPSEDQDAMLMIRRDDHIEYLTKSLRQPSSSFLDTYRPWLCYWSVHSLALLGKSIDDELKINVIDFLKRCQDPNGGYGGGPGQLPHLATTYAAVNSLITIGGGEALSSIKRMEMYNFLMRMKVVSGGFSMHDGGEVDIRACYTAISVASVLNILDDELLLNVGNFIQSCQTYEGGIAAEPGSEAHGGYSFCGLATMVMVDEVQRLDLPRFIDWLVFRQGVEGGLQGRTNKLVDGCYSFWQGGAFPLLQRFGSVVTEQLGFANEAHASVSTGSAHEGTSRSVDEQHNPGEGSRNDSSNAGLSNICVRFLERDLDLPPLLRSFALQDYMLLCCQDPAGGFKDKPGMRVDLHHTCYVLSGLSACQHIFSQRMCSPLHSTIRGPDSNLLEQCHPLYNVILEKYCDARYFFSR